MNRTILTDKAAIAKLIAGIKRTGHKLDTDVQTAAMAVALMAHQHGNVMPLNELFLAMGKGTRHSALTAWLLDAAPVIANSDKATKKEMPFVYSKDKALKGAEMQALLAEHDMEGNQWFDRMPSKAPDEVTDVRALILALMRKVDKKGAKIPTDQVELVHKLHEVFDPVVKNDEAATA